MDALPSTLHEAVAALIRTHRAARAALDAAPLPSDPGPARFLAEHDHRRMHLCLDQMEEALDELAGIYGLDAV